MLIESISGIRGTVGDDLTHSVICDYANAFHRFCPDGEIIIGRDSRSSGRDFVLEIVGRLTQLGRSVRDCGICPTPTVQYVVGSSVAVGGIIVTASHNPSEWNGLKFVGSDGCFLNSLQIDSLMAMRGLDLEIASTFGTCVKFPDAIDRHISRILDVEWIDLDVIKNCSFKVAVDAVNGAAAVALPNLLSQLGCEIVTINCEPSGNFTRGTEPLPENLKDLSQLVLDERCDIGFATDPDADRLAVIDDNGKPIGEEYTLVLSVDSFLNSTQNSFPIATNLSTTLAIEKIAARHGISVLRSAVGEINVVELMKEHGSQIGGEGNGGVILEEVHLGRDSLVATVAILHRLGLADASLSVVMSHLPSFKILKEKISIEGVHDNISFEEIANSFQDAILDLRDGLKLSWADRWVHIRKSNTEPILRIYAEAPTKAEVIKLVKRIKSIVRA